MDKRTGNTGGSLAGAVGRVQSDNGLPRLTLEEAWLVIHGREKSNSNVLHDRGRNGNDRTAATGV